MMNNTKQRPAHEVRLGLIKAAIWKNQTSTGIYYRVTMNRSYREGEQWKDSDSYGRDDLLTLAKVADQANSWIHQQNQSQEE